MLGHLVYGHYAAEGEVSVQPHAGWISRFLRALFGRH